MQVKVNHYHGWFKEPLNFHIENDKIIKIEEGNTVIFSGKFDTQDDIINLSIIMYMFQGTIRYAQASNFDLNKLKKMIYDIEVNNETINFFYFETCKCNICNIERCQKILNYMFTELKIKKIEDLLKYYSGGNKILDQDIEVYEYPDNIMMNIQKFKDKEIILHNIDHTIKKLNDDNYYILRWGR